MCGISNEERLSTWPHDVIVSWTDMKKYHTPQLIQPLGFQELKQTLMVNWKEDNCEFWGWQPQSSRERGLMFFFLAKIQSLKPIHFSVSSSCLVFFFIPVFDTPGIYSLLASIWSQLFKWLQFSVKHSGLPHISLTPNLPFWSRGLFFHPWKLLQQTQPLALA